MMTVTLSRETLQLCLQVLLKHPLPLEVSNVAYNELFKEIQRAEKEELIKFEEAINGRAVGE